HRTVTVMAQLKDLPITVCGAGALRANITENLTRSGFSKLVVIDRDRIEE
ncbi:MAG: ThiF family adenylyltransferase, partial [Microcoleus sp. SIO2G3]|nr:ThiF family adenylyltransferase [Microcoleus sp. SIO2G3]